MSNDFKPKNEEIVKNKVSDLLDKMCLQHESNNIEEDMIALFEDIIKFFSGREEEFLNFEELSDDAKQAIYTEIKNVIALLQQLRGAVDKEAIMQMLSENLINNLSKHSGKFKSIAEQLNKREQKNLKRRFADAILLELHRQRQLYLSQKKNPPKKLMDEIEKYVEKIQETASFKSLQAKHSHTKNVVHKKKNTPDISRRI